MKFISFIGNRNINYHGQPLKKDHSLKVYNDNQKEMAFYLLEEYEKEKEHLEEKIISVFLKDNGFKFEKYFIVGTDQGDPIAGKNDTIYHAEIIKNKLEESFKDCIGKVEVIKYNGDPSDEEEIMVFFKNEMNNYLTKKDDVVFLNAGGTNQLKMNMIFWGIDKENINSFNVFSLNEHSGEMKEANWPRIIKETSIKKHVKDSLDLWEIKYSKSLIDSFNIINKGSREYSLILFLEKRINNLDLIYSIKDLENSQLSSLFKALPEDNKEIIKEIFSLIQILHEKKNYLIITLLLKSFADIFKKLISNENKIIIPAHDNKNARETWNHNIIEKIKEINEPEKEIFFFANSKDGVSKYRNSSLITHGIGSISKDEFDGLFANSFFKSYINFMNEANSVFKWKESYNNYLRVKEEIKKQI